MRGSADALGPRLLAGAVGALAVGARVGAWYARGAAPADGAAEVIEHDLTSPLTAFRSIREARFLSLHGHGPYVGWHSRHPPLLMLPLAAAPEAVVLAVLIAADLLLGWLLLQLGGPSALARRAGAALYLLSPPTARACAALGTAPLGHAPLLAALLIARRGHAALAGAALGVASYVAPDATWMLPAAAMIVWRRARVGRPIVTLLGAWLACTAALLALSRVALGDWSFFSAVYAFYVSAPDLAPNPGAWWYLLAQVFPPARGSFVLAMHAIPALCLPPLALRLRRSPLLAAALSYLIVVAFKPYPALPDLALALGLISTQLDRELLEYCRHVPLALGGMLFALAIGPPLRARWLEARGLNANFYYAATLVLTSALALLAADLAAAAIGRDVQQVEELAVHRLQRRWRGGKGRGMS